MLGNYGTLSGIADSFAPQLAILPIQPRRFDMTRSERVRDLFGTASGLRGIDRASFLTSHCVDDEELRTELEALLVAHDESDERLRRLEEPFEKTIGLAPGQTVGHYAIVDQIGAGGMGVVYKARDEQLKRPVALKFLPAHLVSDETSKKRFILEAQSAAAIDHPNICRIYEIGETEHGQLYIAMAFCDGETIKHRISRGPLSVTEVLDISAQIAEGLARVHEKGIVHRDIKPSNAILHADGLVKIVDFGIAKLSGGEDLTRAAANLGTLAYMSPEQLTGKQVTTSSDIWSLGVMMFEMLTGQQPFRSPYEEAFIYTVLNEDPDPLSKCAPGVPLVADRIVTRCLRKDPADRFESAADLLAALYRARSSLTHYVPGEAQSGIEERVLKESLSGNGRASDGVRLFISYKRGVEPDDSLAQTLCQALAADRDVFLDKHMLIGARWAEQIERELARSDYLIVLLSSESVHSEMILGEIELAYRFAAARGKPSILPIRVANSKPFEYPLRAYVGDVNWAVWDSASDTDRLLVQLRSAIDAGGFDERKSLPGGAIHDTGIVPRPFAAAQPADLDLPEGTMDPQSRFYVQRAEDELALRAIERKGVTITIKGPRQMGKSSLLIRTIATAAALGKRVAFLDFQLFSRKALGDAETFFREFCGWVTEELELEDKVDEFWQRPLGQSQRCTRYFGRHILKMMDQPLVLAMDEVETVFAADFRSDFFGMLRSWHNDRALKREWKRLDLVLVTSTEPYQLIENLNQSPFNVGEVLELTDFDSESVADLNARHGSPLNASEQVELVRLLHGHPYLTRKAMYLIVRQRNTFAQIIESAARDDGPFGDHLRHHLFRLHGQQDLISGLHEVLRTGSCADESVFWRLRGAGLVRRSKGLVVPRCAVYAEYFKSRLHD